MEKLPFIYTQEDLAWKINDLIDSHNRLEKAVRYLAAYAGEKPNERINEILKGE